MIKRLNQLQRRFRTRTVVWWDWFIHLPRFILGIVLVQTGLMIALFVYAWIRKRTVENTFLHLEYPEQTIGDHRVQLFDDGYSAFEDMLAAIDQAEDVIFFESYIFEGDKVGRRFKHALLRKARQGVRVYVVVDGIGSLHVPMRFKLKWWRQNVRVFEFGRLQKLRSYLAGQIWVRDHRKMLVVDGKIAYLGGMNIGREYADMWRDTQLKIVGPLAVTLAHDFVYLWNKHYKRPPIELVKQPVEDPFIRYYTNRPFERRFPIREAFLELIRNAQRNIYIANAYFIPDHEILRAVIDAARRGVDVQIMIPLISDNIIVDWMARSLVLDLLQAEVRVLLYQGTMLHSKSITVDGRFGVLGSVNFDNRSLWVNYELAVVIEDETFVRQMDAMYLNDRTQCRGVILEEWCERPLLQQFGEWLLRPVRRFF